MKLLDQPSLSWSQKALVKVSLFSDIWRQSMNEKAKTMLTIREGWYITVKYLLVQIWQYATELNIPNQRYQSNNNEERIVIRWGIIYVELSPMLQCPTTLKFLEILGPFFLLFSLLGYLQQDSLKIKLVRRCWWLVDPCASKRPSKFWSFKVLNIQYSRHCCRDVEDKTNDN